MSIDHLPPPDDAHVEITITLTATPRGIRSRTRVAASEALGETGCAALSALASHAADLLAETMTAAIVGQATAAPPPVKRARHPGRA